MSLDKATVIGIARLARIRVSDDDLEKLGEELAGILGWIERLEEVDVSGVSPMTGVMETRLRGRDDAVTDGDRAAEILSNAPRSEAGFFVVPKVVE